MFENPKAAIDKIRNLLFFQRRKVMNVPSKVCTSKSPKEDSFEEALKDLETFSSNKTDHAMGNYDILAFGPIEQ
jgi:hypothetical protein